MKPQTDGITLAMKPPHDWVNRALLGAARFFPRLKEAKENQKQWEGRFYADGEPGQA